MIKYDKSEDKEKIKMAENIKLKEENMKKIKENAETRMAVHTQCVLIDAWYKVGGMPT